MLRLKTARNTLKGVKDKNGATIAVLLHFSNATRQLFLCNPEWRKQKGTTRPISTDAIAVHRRPASGQQQPFRLVSSHRSVNGSAICGRILQPTGALRAGRPFFIPTLATTPRQTSLIPGVSFANSWRFMICTQGERQGGSCQRIRGRWPQRADKRDAFLPLFLLLQAGPLVKVP